MIESPWKTPGTDPQPYWWGMPEYTGSDMTPAKRLTVNFATLDDYEAFAALVGQKLTPKTRSIWHPAPEREPRGVKYYDGPKTATRYPVCIPSKGRWDCQTTGHVLDRMGVDYRFFVEETEADKYREALGEARVVSMPFHDLGQGSIPARNFIWTWAKERGHARHWVVDDNIKQFHRNNANKRLRCFSGVMFRAMEDFADRYENVAMCGPHERGFCASAGALLSPVMWNTRVYSCILIDTSLDLRWRGRYNEDTDLSLRVLKSGLCTAVFSALLMSKASTVGTRSGRPMKGGNTDNVYNTGDHRLAFAKSLQEQHPDVVSVAWRYDRWHHVVDYSPFANNAPRLKSGVVPTGKFDDYGLQLRRSDEMSDDDDGATTT